MIIFIFEFKKIKILDIFSYNLQENIKCYIIGIGLPSYNRKSDSSFLILNILIILSHLPALAKAEMPALLHEIFCIQVYCQTTYIKPRSFNDFFPNLKTAHSIE